MMRADGVELPEGNMLVSDKASKRVSLRGRRARHDEQCVDSNSGDPRCSPNGSMTDNATNGGSQMAAWESDAVIVPQIPGNAGGGKDGTRVGPVQGTHFLYTGIEGKMSTKLDRIEEMSVTTTGMN